AVPSPSSSARRLRRPSSLAAAMPSGSPAPSTAPTFAVAEVLLRRLPPVWCHSPPSIPDLPIGSLVDEQAAPPGRPPRTAGGPVPWCRPALGGRSEAMTFDPPHRGGSTGAGRPLRAGRFSG